MDRELLLLGLLRQSDMHGYRLNEFIERAMATCVDLKKPTAYFLLDKMVGQGWITQHEEREGNRPPRRVYRVTAEGEAQFQALLRANLAQYHAAKFTSDIGLAFADALAPAEALDLLRQRRAVILDALDETRAAPQHHGSLHWLIQHRLFHLETELRWLDQVIAQLQTSTDASTLTS